MKYKLKTYPINKSILHVHKKIYFLSKEETNYNELYKNQPLSLIMVDKPNTLINRNEYYLTEKGIDIANETIETFDKGNEYCLKILAIYPEIKGLKTFSKKFFKKWIKDTLFEIPLRIKNNEIIY